jgi:molybdenum cofactor sulfurtransferase
MLWDCWRIESLANLRRLSVRAGCHCNPGAREVALGHTRAQLATCFKDKDRLSYAEFLRRVRGLECKDGVVRASLGLATTFKDVYQFVEFSREFVDRHARTDERAARTELQMLLAPSGARA